MKPIQTFTIEPSLPDNLKRLKEIAYNLFWTWHPESIRLFHRIDPELWEGTGHNPVLMLGLVGQQRLESLSADDGFVSQLDRIWNALQGHVNNKSTWFDKLGGTPEGFSIAYYSAEFGVSDALPVYSGGLGVLAGDHMKSSSELGLPLTGVGLLYQNGYFRQYLNIDGWQQESYPVNDFYNLPVTPVRREDASPLTVSVEFPGRDVHAQVWKAQIGRNPIYMLDTNLPQNAPADRSITGELYGGDTEMRIKQEMILGIGGTRALKALGIAPTVYHMNEGHSAFLGLERIRGLMDERGLNLAEAKKIVAASTVFTTHTPVPAGIDRFTSAMIEKYIKPFYERLGFTLGEFMAMGQAPGAKKDAPLNMAILAIHLAAHRNGVSKLHGVVARRMWKYVWPGIPESEIPIDSVTNGIHYHSWVSRDMADLYDRYLGPKWLEDPSDTEIWRRVDKIPAEELWRTHGRRRERLVAFARRRMKQSLSRRGASPAEVERAEEMLNPHALTIGFARRFATYKRAALILRDPERLARILNNPVQPVQLIFAGKAHPRDAGGKEINRRIVHLSRREEFRDKIVFIEDYDINVARYMVQGVDLWLNTPRRLEEASGTSGMKVSANGGLNLSIPDGWWDEAYTPEVGWAIGNGELYDDTEYQDRVESEAIYDLLEKEIVVLFFDRRNSNLPRKWIAKMKQAMRSLCPVFNSNRMVGEYAQRFYFAAGNRYNELVEEDNRGAKMSAQWFENVNERWQGVKILAVTPESVESAAVGGCIDVSAEIDLGGLKPEDVDVEIYHGALDEKGMFAQGEAIQMNSAVRQKGGSHIFTGALPFVISGRHGYTVRVLPAGEKQAARHELALVHWA